MTQIDRIWIKSMEWCSKYWGCHQIPERSFFIKGYQMPVCARCSGMIIGELSGIICAFSSRISIWVCVLMLIPLIIDGSLQYKTSYMSNNTKRVITGLLFGFGLLYLITNGIIHLIKSILP